MWWCGIVYILPVLRNLLPKRTIKVVRRGQSVPQRKILSNLIYFLPYSITSSSVTLFHPLNILKEAKNRVTKEGKNSFGSDEIGRGAQTSLSIAP